jgi:hypothetical protein
LEIGISAELNLVIVGLRTRPLVQERPPVVIAYSASRSAVLQRRFNTSSKFNTYL